MDSYPRYPRAIVTRSMNNCYHVHGIAVPSVDDLVWIVAWNKPTGLYVPIPDAMPGSLFFFIWTGSVFSAALARRREAAEATQLGQVHEARNKIMASWFHIQILVLLAAGLCATGNWQVLKEAWQY